MKMGCHEVYCIQCMGRDRGNATQCQLRERYIVVSLGLRTGVETDF